jgi:hypothetical protein
MKEGENDNGSVTEYKQRVKECYAPVDFCFGIGASIYSQRR